ncbi:Notopleural [Carabus blaptoides fortunei]
MQPAYITANIGASTGRNIRRLPCVSRKSGMGGTCMFAIDCLKSNGTHLGTCIDRFYFGSCCHIEPNNDLSSNVIDTAIMPDRQPPYRMSSTTERVLVPVNTTEATAVTTVRPVEVSTTKTITTMTRRPSPSVATTEKLVTMQKVTPPRIPSTTTMSTTTVTDTSTRVRPTTTTMTTESFKLSTFQSVDDGTEATTLKLGPSSIKVTAKPVPTKPRPRPTVKPTLVTTKPTQTTKPIIKSTTTKTSVTVKPTRPSTTTKTPVTVKSTRPSTTTKTPVTRPVTVKPTRPSTTTKTSVTVKPTRPSTTTKTPVTAKPTRPSTTTSGPVKTSTIGKPIKISSTQRPNVTQTTLKSSTTKGTTVKPISTTSTSTSTSTSVASTTKLADSVVEETRPLTTASAISNEVLLGSTKIPLVETVSGNTATNEIIQQPAVVVLTTTEKPTTQGPGLVTWAMVNNNEQTTKATLTNNSNKDADEWTPITPPDGWVLLPSVSTATLQVANDTTTESPQTTTTIINDVTMQTTLAITTSTNSPNVDTTTATLELVPLMNTSSSANTEETTPSAGLPTDSPVSTAKPVNMTDHTDVCGRRMYPEPRIVGGEKSSFGKWPWQISLRQWKTSTYLHKCGAALLNENWAITAAHCVENVPPNDLLLRLGEHDLSTDSEPYIHQERRVQIVALHPQFDPRTFEYDLALLRFYEPVQFQPNIIPVCVPQDDESFVGRSAFVTGWGRLYEDGPLPSVLQEVSVPVINNTVCESMYRNAGYIEHIPNIFICAGWKHGGFDSCEGDSGGPMVIQRPDKRFLLAGIISWGIGCAEPNQPGVYTRISEFRDWINQILQF